MSLKNWLAFGAHADDVEIGMGAAIKKETESGREVIICDLTEAELSSNGSVEIRKKEAEGAAHILGVKERVNLQLPDRGLYLHEAFILKMVSCIRKYKPEYVFAPYWVDRHPDHGNCAKLVKEAVFSAGIKNIKDPNERNAHKVRNIFYYFINSTERPSLFMDVSDSYSYKIEALKAYPSQFVKRAGSVDTPLTNGYIERVEARDKLFGLEAGTLYAEGFIPEQTYVTKNL
ncbi:bacillithiol biosynthesis deacetylase BshB1 [Fictibacillus phosphorivorans]|uniref:bacillithiol biosynthesis deacetylase BshB1 n=1 Tax=Fictibacillus phosphorivorans TaxID=1221500 RepID=UPI0020422E80|nr:bacillithiol biosynthesis deacetylase BshB1 [Fictibacillus phosphorivorans]MCM3718909.1 bacillithiol biosynthesis deacetylase BshB1 [Fictibacillus phosphorivorans]MCM3776531.1 bacillithiol biosynthesis deacetylase BshB1 [Fictibacillus phosphorivorans]